MGIQGRRDKECPSGPEEREFLVMSACTALRCPKCFEFASLSVDLHCLELSSLPTLSVLLYLTGSAYAWFWVLHGVQSHLALTLHHSPAVHLFRVCFLYLFIFIFLIHTPKKEHLA